MRPPQRMDLCVTSLATILFLLVSSISCKSTTDKFNLTSVNSSTPSEAGNGTHVHRHYNAITGITADYPYLIVLIGMVILTVFILVGGIFCFFWCQPSVRTQSLYDKSQSARSKRYKPPRSLANRPPNPQTLGVSQLSERSKALGAKSSSSRSRSAKSTIPKSTIPKSTIPKMAGPKSKLKSKVTSKVLG